MTVSDSDYSARLEQIGRYFMGGADVPIALARLAQRLEELGIPYAICGGLAVNAHGYVRTTTRIDVLLTPQGLAQFKKGAVGHGWV